MNSQPSFSIEPIGEHHALVAKHHRFESRVVEGEEWDFSHLEAFSFKVPITLSPSVAVDMDVIVLFSNHCFTRAIRPDETVSPEWIFEDAREKRILDRARYELSRQHLLPIVKNLPARRILLADPSRPNYVTIEIPSIAGEKPQHYAIFFEVERDKLRQKRVLLRIQSAYVLEQMTKRLQQAEKINFSVLLKRAYLHKNQRSPK